MFTIYGKAKENFSQTSMVYFRNSVEKLIPVCYNMVQRFHDIGNSDIWMSLQVFMLITYYILPEFLHRKGAFHEIFKNYFCMSG